MKRILSLMLVIAMFVVLLCGCNVEPTDGTGSDGENSDATPEADKVNFYGLSPLLKPYRDMDVSSYGDGINCSLDLSLAHNEYENGQFIIKSNYDVSSVNVTVGELKSADGSVFPKENVEVYREHYVQFAGDGIFRPIALIPMFDGSDGGFKNDEFDLTANYNQGYMITVHATKDVAPGIYTGNVTVKYGENTKQIPVSVEVWDFEIPETSSFTAWYEYWIGMTNDWYYAWHRDIYDTVDMNELNNQYMDFIRKNYRMNVGPDISEYSTTDYDKYAQELRTQIDEGYVKTFLIAFSYEEGKTAQELAEMNRTRIEILDKYGLLEYGFVYIVDEPHTPEMYAKANLVDEALAILSPDARQFVTIYPQEGLIENTKIWCPVVEYLSHDAVDAAHAQGTRYWSYGIRQFDEINDGIDRYKAWANEYMRADGFLMWIINLFRRFELHGAESDSFYVDRDVWNEGASWGNEGGGYLIYPGAEGDGIVGRNMPIPTIDLEVERCGLEDYEYFHMLRNRYTSFASEWGISLNMDDIMYTYYQPVFTYYSDIATTSRDVKLGDDVRKIAAEDIMNDTKAIVAVYNYTSNDVPNGRKVSVYAPVGAEVVIDGKTVSGADIGGCYEYSSVIAASSLNKTIEITVDGAVYHRIISAMRDYDFYDYADSALRRNATILGVDKESAESGLYANIMESKFTLLADAAVNRFIADYGTSDMPFLYTVDDFLTAEGSTAYKKVSLYVLPGTVPSMSGAEVKLETSLEKCDVYTALVNVGEKLYNLIPVTFTDGNGKAETQSLLVLQHITSSAVLVDLKSPDLSGQLASVSSNKTDKGYTKVTEDGISVRLGYIAVPPSDDGTELPTQSLVHNMVIPKSSLKVMDASKYTTLRVGIYNPTDKDESGLFVKFETEKSEKQVSSVNVPARSTVYVDIDLTTLAADRLTDVKRIIFSHFPEAIDSEYVVTELYLYIVQ